MPLSCQEHIRSDSRSTVSNDSYDPTGRYRVIIRSKRSNMVRDACERFSGRSIASG